MRHRKCLTLWVLDKSYKTPKWVESVTVMETRNKFALPLEDVLNRIAFQIRIQKEDELLQCQILPMGKRPLTGPADKEGER